MDGSQTCGWLTAKQGGGATLSSADQVTELLLAWSKGDRAIEDRLFGVVYKELHRLAGRHMLREPAGNSFQATALVHEVYLRLIDQSRVNWENRSHFFAIAARLMRRILVDHARARRAAKRPQPGRQVSLTDLPLGVEFQTVEVLALDEALEQLETIDPRQARIVEMRFIAGLSEEEIACALDVSVRTVKREWRIARAWLYGRLCKESHGVRAVGAS
jgi:RNA polymerase sigma factor (TIGR02999 family)